MQKQQKPTLSFFAEKMGLNVSRSHLLPGYDGAAM
jgi:hypothetical protein